MTITKRLSSVNTTLLRGRKIEYIVIHYTAGVTSKGGAAINTANWFASGNASSSSDYIVDDKYIIEYNPDIRNRYTWHCGGVKYNNKGGSLYGIATNKNSIGIEMCSTNSTGKITNANDKYWSFSDAVVDNTIDLVKYLMDKYSIDAEHIIRHYDTTGKPCPGIIGWNADSGNESKWIEFKSKLKPQEMYRVRKSWSDIKSQIGAFTNLESAKALADKNIGYEVYNNAGKIVYKPSIYADYVVSAFKAFCKAVPTANSKIVKYLDRGTEVKAYKGVQTTVNGVVYAKCIYQRMVLWIPLKYLKLV